jgi:hypothetical protein
VLGPAAFAKLTTFVSKHFPDKLLNGRTRGAAAMIAERVSGFVLRKRQPTVKVASPLDPALPLSNHLIPLLLA